MGAFRDLTGQIFGRLTVLGHGGWYVQPNGTKGSLWRCACSCGREMTARVGKLNNGHTRSCGCLQAERRGSAQVTHRASRTAEYHAWQGIRKRCYLSSHKSYARYGGRGIALCARWQESCAFLADMGPRPSPRHSIDRIDNARGYECGRPDCTDCGPAQRSLNCRWATPIEQSRNRSDNRIVEIDGERRCIAEWGELRGVAQSVIASRLRSGWDPARAVMQEARRG